VLFDAQVAAFALVALVVTITPGPDTFLVMRSALAGGFARGLAVTWGILSGLVLHALVAAAGLSAILLRSARLFEAVKLAGAAYLVWLGIQSLRAAGRRPAARDLEPEPPGVARRGSRSAFVEGLLNNLLNPKVVVFYVAFLPQFVRPGDPVLAKTLLLVAIHFAMGLVWLPGVALFVDRAASAIQRPGFRRALEAGSGAILTALGLRLALDRR
jgi:threonine/homoserine/homoserine lactone efflux protein